MGNGRGSQMNSVASAEMFHAKRSPSTALSRNPREKVTQDNPPIESI